VSEREGATFVREEDGRMVWSVQVWLPMGRGRWNSYEVRTRALPSGRVECIGPNHRRYHIKPGATRCNCFDGQWGGCIHLLAARAHLKRTTA